MREFKSTKVTKQISRQDWAASARMATVTAGLVNASVKHN